MEVLEPKWNQNGSFGTKMEPKLDFGNQNLIFGTKMEPKLDFWNQNGTKILKYTEFLSKKRSHEFTPNPWAPWGPSDPSVGPWGPFSPVGV